MTNEQLLQQAKDQVAKDNGFINWYEMEAAYPDLFSYETFMGVLYQSSILAIQRAREEAGKPGRYKLWHPEFQEWIYWGFIDGMYVGPPTGRGLTLDYIQEHSKLTAPGR